MYILLLAVILGLGILLAAHGYRRQQRLLMIIGVGVVAAGGLFFALLGFWGEMLWFESLGYNRRFWTVIWAQVGTALAGALIGALGVALLSWSARSRVPGAKFLAPLVGAVIGGLWGLQAWDKVLLFLNRVSGDLEEPILGQDTGFYLFTLPLLDQLFWLGLVLAGASLLIALGSLLDWSGDEIQPRETPRQDKSTGRGVLPAVVALAGALAFGLVLQAFHLLYSSWGVVAGPGWTDVHIRLPGYFIVAASIVVLAVTLLLAPVQRLFRRRFASSAPLDVPILAGVGAVAGIATVIGLLALGVAPNLIQWLVVEPNEITYETPYIKHNIDFTRRGFELHQIEERQFPAKEQLKPQDIERNQSLLSNVRLWDWRALDAVYRQFQEIRLYYEFHDVDIDRYTLEGDYREVMVSARELNQSNLPQQSQTFVNKRFKFTHGYGLTLTPVNEFTPEGLPNLLIKDIPPQSEIPKLEVTRPQIYYGELTRGPAVVNTEEAEFDYPRGEQNVYIRYPGTGGVELSNLWRKFLYGWMFDGTRFLLSSYPTPESRVLFHRQIQDRVSTLAPFLEFDEDPYIVLADGRLYWIIDAYTTSSYYPYSEPFTATERIETADPQGQYLEQRIASYLNGVNYVRNAVKVVVDAFEGTTDFYVFEPEDPLIRAWQGVFPDLFKASADMPDQLRAHVRYPAGLLLAQGLVYAKYHMEDPTVFYNQEDLWVRATEKYYNQVQPVEPYYIMWQLPESERLEFVLILPFTPKNRQVLIGWIAGLSDGDNYGRFLAYKFPKEKRILGPQQVETKIDQDRFLSGQLTLWDQRGSNVIRGNMLAIPIADTLLYVEPIYLQAETAAYPELRLVVVMHEDNLSYAESFDQALQGLFEGQRAPQQALPLEGSLQELAKRANEAFKAYLRLQNEQRFEAAAEKLQNLRDILQKLAGGEGRDQQPQ